MITVSAREQVAQWRFGVGEILRSRLEIERKLDRADRLRSLRRTRVRQSRGPIDLPREKAANPLPGCTFLIFTVQEGTSPS
jgi:hypothetical protein